MTQRYFTSSPIKSDTATLDGPEAHHLAHVMRAKPGESVTLFDGTGCEFAAEIVQVKRAEIMLRVHDRREVNREPRVRVTVAVALPKGDRQKWLVEKLTELGAARLIPLETARSVSAPTASAIERLERSVIEASKQCGRNRLMEISPAKSWHEFLLEASAGPRLLAHPPAENAPPISLATLLAEIAARQEVTFAVGPEGGFADDEVTAALAAGWQGISLGRRVLRVETAAAALVLLATLHDGD